MNKAYCSTCGIALTSSPILDEKTEKPSTRPSRQVDCCGRQICGACIERNARFAEYCPFCQISSRPSTLPQGLRDPPAYSPLPSPAAPAPAAAAQDEPPAYTSLPPRSSPTASSISEPPQDTLHFVDPAHDTVPSLALRYGVPINALRRSNGLYSDHLLSARRTVVIPAAFYKGGVSLSPTPIEGEEEEARKAKVRRWMVACKEAEYDLALIYLKHADYDLDKAVEAYKSDEKWEREHPLKAARKGKRNLR